MARKNSFLRTFVTLLLIALIVYIAGAAVYWFSGSAEGLVYEKRDYTVSAAEVNEIRIMVRNIPLTVTPSDGNEITVHYATCEKDPYKITLDGGVLMLQYKNENLFGFNNLFSGVYQLINHLFPKAFTDSNPEVEVIVPSAYAGKLELSDSNASVNISGLTKAGEVYIDTSNASVHADHLSAVLLIANTSNGRITLEKVDVSGAVDIKSSNGSLTVSQTTANDSLRMVTSNSRITVDQAASAIIEMYSSNGSISGSVEGKRSDYTVYSSTSNGGNNLGSGGSGQYKLTAVTSNSSIDIRFLGD